MITSDDILDFSSSGYHLVVAGTIWSLMRLDTGDILAKSGCASHTDARRAGLMAARVFVPDFGVMEALDVINPEKDQMSAAGFTWDPGITGQPRWTHQELGIVALREQWMNVRDWDKRRAEKIADTLRLARYTSLAIGTRFRRQALGKVINNVVYVKIDWHRVIEWAGQKQHASSLIMVLSSDDMSISGSWCVVEPFEPLDGLHIHEKLQVLKFPQTWNSLADYCDQQSAEAEAMDFVDCSKHSDERAALFRARAAAIFKSWDEQ